MQPRFVVCCFLLPADEEEDGTGCIQNENPHIGEWWEKSHYLDEGNLFMATSHGKAPDMVFLLELAKSVLMNRCVGEDS